MTTKNFENITGGCPCESFNCDSLNEIAESCKDLTSNKNYQFCYEEQKTTLDQCLQKCETYECFGKCSATFEAELERCPCAPKCPCKSIIDEKSFLFMIHCHSFNHLFSWLPVRELQLWEHWKFGNQHSYFIFQKHLWLWSVCSQ